MLCDSQIQSEKVVDEVRHVHGAPDNDKDDDEVVKAEPV